VIAIRTDSAAEEEIRLVFRQIAQICVRETLGLLQDLRRSHDGTWTPEDAKL
jgi:hypothetical protein